MSQKERASTDRHSLRKQAKWNWGVRTIKSAPLIFGNLAGGELSGLTMADLSSRREVTLMFAVWLLANVGALYIWSRLVDDVYLAWRSRRADDEDRNLDE